MKRLGCTLVVATLLCGSSVRAADNRQELFGRVFGDAVKLDPAMVAKVKAGKPGERFLVDRNGDGKNDEVWYIDNAMKGGIFNPSVVASVQPLLVRAIDEDGDLDSYKGPDLDSDLYVADYRADGTIDAVLDYADMDADNDVDEMAFYFYMKHHPFFGDDVLRVWWGRDDGDDNLLWYDVNYNYDQGMCQYRCHFSGDESFVAFGMLLDSAQWLSAFENPFLFYDPDHDNCSEVVLRIEGQANQVRAIRYSFDVDDDAYGRRTHDYDFSITALAEEGKPVQLPEDVLISTKLRGIPTQGWLHRGKACEFVERAKWAKSLLTWDEMNANTEQDDRDPHERWEGIIAQGNQEFRQVGGPPCSKLNKRNELCPQPRESKGGANRSSLGLYYDPSDRKLHLDGAREGWLDVDYNFDGKVDAQYTWRDDNNDGRFDRRRIDLDADGTIDLEFKMQPLATRSIMLEWRRLMPFYKLSLPKILDDSQAFLDAARAVLPEAEADPVASFFANELSAWKPETGLGAYIRKSPAGQRYYMDLIRDRALLRLKKEFGDRAGWAEIERQYGLGEYAQAAELVRQVFGGADGASTQPATAPAGAKSSLAFGEFTKRIALNLDNARSSARPDWPVVIAVNEIRKIAPDFNPDNCAVVDGRRWIAWRQLPHQVDEVDSAVGPELSFIADLPGHAPATYYLYYSPEGKSGQTFELKTGTAEDWVPPNIGWESNRCAYRAYWGQFDFFGKKTEQLVYENIGKKSYHAEVEWGIDALHVGKASGLGGLTLYQDGKEYLVQNPAGKGDVKFTKKQLVKGPVRAAIEIDASNIVPEQPDLAVKMLCIIYAERQETEVRTTVAGAKADSTLGMGLVKLPRESTFENQNAAAIGSWGWQEEAIGDIGMAVIAPPAAFVKTVDLPEERRLLCKTESGKIRYWLIGDWRRGRQHPVAPTIDNWKKEVDELGGLLNKPVAVTFGEAETVKQ